MPARARRLSPAAAKLGSENTVAGTAAGKVASAAATTGSLANAPPMAGPKMNPSEKAAPRSPSAPARRSAGVMSAT